MKNIFKSYKIYTFIAILLFVCYLFFLYFRVTNIYVSGSTYGYHLQITSFLNRGDKNKSIFIISNKTLLNQIMSVYPLASSVNVSKKFPSMVNVKINSSNIVYTYIYKGKSYFVGSNGGYITGNITNIYPTVYSSIPLNYYYKTKLLSLVSKVDSQFLFSVNVYKLNNQYVSLTLSNGLIVLVNFNKSISLQISQIIDVEKTLDIKNCPILNVEFSKIFCSGG